MSSEAASAAQERNIETIRRSMDVIESGQPDRLRRLVEETIHPDCEWTPLIASGVEGSYRGRDGILSFFEDFRGSFEPRYRDRHLRAIEDNIVLLLCRLELRGQESGVQVDQEMGSVFEFQGGMLRRGHAYPSHAEAIKAARALGA